MQWVPEHRLGAFGVGVGRRVVADRAAGRRGCRGGLEGTKADAASACSGRVADAEKRQGEALERAVRLAEERTSRALASASASGQITHEAPTLRPPPAPLDGTGFLQMPLQRAESPETMQDIWSNWDHMRSHKTSTRAKRNTGTQRTDVTKFMHEYDVDSIKLSVGNMK